MKLKVANMKRFTVLSIKNGYIHHINKTNFAIFSSEIKLHVNKLIIFAR